MDAYKYLELLNFKWREEASYKKLTASTSVSLDWGELKFILEHVETYEKLLLLVRMFYQETKDENTKHVIRSVVRRAAHRYLEDQYLSTEETCYVCNNMTRVTRSEQYRVVEKEVKVRCHNCLISQYAETSTEIEQLLEYRLFVKENQLEEKFEYYSQERRNGQTY